MTRVELLELEGKRLARRIRVQAACIITAKINLEKITSGNMIHNLGFVKHSLFETARSLRGSVKRYEDKIKTTDTSGVKEKTK